VNFLERLLRSESSPVEAMITDVTQMSGDKVCIAGLTRRSAIRLSEPTPRQGWLDSIGGLAPGDVVNLNWRPARRYRRPHGEDGTWNPSTLVKTSTLPTENFFERLEAGALRSIVDAFGRPWFYSERGNPAFKPDRGSRSLATVKVHFATVYGHGDGIRVDFRDDKTTWTMVPVEDLALRRRRPPEGLNYSETILRAGLGRPFQANDKPAACYLQVNHILECGEESKGVVQ